MDLRRKEVKDTAGSDVELHCDVIGYPIKYEWRDEKNARIGTLYVFLCALVSSCSNTGSIRDDPYWTSRKNSLELIELSSINIVSLVIV